MVFFISTAVADAAAPTGGSNSLVSFLPMLFFIGIIYFLLIRPQQKRAKQHQALVAAIKKGDKVITNSGIIGTVVKVVNDQEVMIEIADKVFVKFVKSTISAVITPTQNAPETSSAKASESPIQIEDKKEEGKKISDKPIKKRTANKTTNSKK